MAEKQLSPLESCFFRKYKSFRKQVLIYKSVWKGNAEKLPARKQLKLFDQKVWSKHNCSLCVFPFKEKKNVT